MPDGILPEVDPVVTAADEIVVNSIPGKFVPVMLARSTTLRCNVLPKNNEMKFFSPIDV